MAKRNDKGKWDLKPQKSSAAQFLTYIASTGASDEKFEIRKGKGGKNSTKSEGK